jgi:hypothetical protein
MKQFISSVLILGAAMFAMIACDDSVVSAKHNYTEAEIKMRDSLEALKNNVKANYVFSYDVTIPLDTVNYRSVEVPVDQAILLAKLGFTTLDELVASMGTVTSGVQYDYTTSFFAINNSTRYDYSGALTASGFGHWFDKNGDVCSWGDTDELFSELTPETFTFNIGQHPKHSKTGDKNKLIQVIKKGDYRIAFVFNITMGEYYVEEIPKAVNVATTELSLEVSPDNDYVTTDLSFSFADAAAAIGVSESELSANSTFYGISSDAGMTATYTADAGYWYSNVGDITDWGTEGCTLFVNYDEGTFHIGQFPDACKAGDEFKFSVAIMYKTTKMVTYKITLKIV